MAHYTTIVQPLTTPLGSESSDEIAENLNLCHDSHRNARTEAPTVLERNPLLHRVGRLLPRLEWLAAERAVHERSDDDPN